MESYPTPSLGMEIVPGGLRLISRPSEWPKSIGIIVQYIVSNALDRVRNAGTRQA
jgi:hypothetical protein